MKTKYGYSSRSRRLATPRDQDGMTLEQGGEQWVRKKSDAALETSFRIRHTLVAVTGTGEGTGTTLQRSWSEQQFDSGRL